MFEILERRENGSFVILKNNIGYHVIPGESEWEPVCEQEGVDPAAQAAIYAASLVQPVLDPEIAQEE